MVSGLDNGPGMWARIRARFSVLTMAQLDNSLAMRARVRARVSGLNNTPAMGATGLGLGSQV